MTDSVNDGRSTATGRSLGVSRYDLVLAVIPAAFIFALLIGYLFSLPSRTTLIAASVVGVGAMFDGLFRNPPENTGSA
ncbi:hypothetical protein [Halostella pelagica]|uniref:hypothetical protein n=1 Tax=Halostella pelagica TaxID=2583824 RepID=UPI0010809220|nr:hypothetical protein [Halostella pelagica]